VDRSSQTSGKASSIQSLVYLIGGGLFAGAILLRMLLVFYGVRIHPLLFFELTASLAICCGGILSPRRPRLGRTIAIVGVIALITIWIPWVNSIIPVHDVIPSPIAYIVVVAYVVLAGFVFLFPSRFWFSIPAVILILLAGIISGARTYVHRSRIGEYAWPDVECFVWDADGAKSLTVKRDDYGYINGEAKEILERVGIRGTVSWHGGSVNSGNHNRILVIASKKPPATSRLYHPRNGLIIYLFDGDKWTKLPPEAETYARYSTFERPDSDNPDNMICSEEVDGSSTGCVICLGSMPDLKK
jgi:hypothetical protein